LSFASAKRDANDAHRAGKIDDHLRIGHDDIMQASPIDTYANYVLKDYPCDYRSSPPDTTAANSCRTTLSVSPASRCRASARAGSAAIRA